MVERLSKSTDAEGLRISYAAMKAAEVARMTDHHALAPDGGVRLAASALCRAAGMDPDGGARSGYGWRDHESDARALLAALATQQPSAAGREEVARIIGGREMMTEEEWLEEGKATARELGRDPDAAVVKVMATRNYGAHHEHRTRHLAKADAILALARPQRDAEVERLKEALAAEDDYWAASRALAAAFARIRPQAQAAFDAATRRRDAARAALSPSKGGAE